MPTEISTVPLLNQLRQLRKGRHRVFASIVATYAVNLPFFEDVVLRHLEAAGSRLNVVLVDRGQLGKAFAAPSTMPRRAGIDYLLLPIAASGAFHPKIIALFTDEGAHIAVGSHNLTEAGFGWNRELTTIFGFSREPAPTKISRAVTSYLMQCAGELASGDSALSHRLAEKLHALGSRGSEAEDDVNFVGMVPGETPLIESALDPKELSAAKRILVLGPYFDGALKFLAELRRRAVRAQVTVAIQPLHAVMKSPSRLPAGVRLCNADGLRSPNPFIHAKALIVETNDQMVAVIGSANPSAPAWLDGSELGNFEAVVTFRRLTAKKIVRQLGLDQFWDAPILTNDQIKQIASRSQNLDADDSSGYHQTVAGLWQDGWVSASIDNGVSKIRTISPLNSAGNAFSVENVTYKSGSLRFAAPTAGIFLADVGSAALPIVIIASSADQLKRGAVSGDAERLIDHLGRLGDGNAPDEELLNLCERVLWQPEEKDGVSAKNVRAPKGETRADQEEPGSATYTPRGISISETKAKSGRKVAVSLDISAIITLLLKELEPDTTDEGDPTSEEQDPDSDRTRERDRPAGVEWAAIVRAVRPRVTRLLNRLSDRLSEPSFSPKWKFERVLVALALLKRLRKFHPGTTIPFTARPEHLVDQSQVREALGLATSCWFSRDEGIIRTLDSMGGIDREHEIIGRALLLWTAYEAGVDVAAPQSFHMDEDELHSVQIDRTDALVAALAATADVDTLDRGRREIFDRGNWAELCDRPERIEEWFQRHTLVGRALQRAIARNKPPALPVLPRTPSIQDIVVWKKEPGWPWFAEFVSGKTVHLTDVGSDEPTRVAQQFIQPIDIESLRIGLALAPKPAPKRIGQ